MRVLIAYNLHRGGGGSDAAALATAQLLRDRGVETATFERSSAGLEGVQGMFKAFWNGLYAPAAVHEFGDVLRSFKPDVVHVHELYPLISPWVLRLARRHHVPTVMTCHDYRLTCPVATHYSHGELCTACLDGTTLPCALKDCRGNRLESVAYAARAAVARQARLFESNVTRYITPTRFAKDWLVDHANLEAARVDVIPYIIESPSSPADPREGSYVAFAGRFVPEKGASILAEACRRLGLPLRMAGDASQSSDDGLTGDEDFVGLLDREAMRAFYRQARIFVIPSTWFETFGIVAGEALANGIPVIASRIGALAEVVRDGEFGLLFEPGSVEDLMDKLSALWRDPERCRSMGLAGRAGVLAECHEDVHFQRLLATYEMAVSDNALVSSD